MWYYAGVFRGKRNGKWCWLVKINPEFVDSISEDIENASFLGITRVFLREESDGELQRNLTSMGDDYPYRDEKFNPLIYLHNNK